MVRIRDIGVFRVGQMGATHPPKGLHPFFIFAPRCRGGCKKNSLFTSLHPNDTSPFQFDDVI